MENGKWKIKGCGGCSGLAEGAIADAMHVHHLEIFGTTVEH